MSNDNNNSTTSIRRTRRRTIVRATTTIPLEERFKGGVTNEGSRSKILMRRKGKRTKWTIMMMTLRQQQ